MNKKCYSFDQYNSRLIIIDFFLPKEWRTIFNLFLRKYVMESVWIQTFPTFSKSMMPPPEKDIPVLCGLLFKEQVKMKYVIKQDVSSSRFFSEVLHVLLLRRLLLVFLLPCNRSCLSKSRITVLLETWAVFISLGICPAHKKVTIGHC